MALNITSFVQSRDKRRHPKSDIRGNHMSGQATRQDLARCNFPETCFLLKIASC
jgi:hypothetical protein